MGIVEIYNNLAFGNILGGRFPLPPSACPWKCSIEKQLRVGEGILKEIHTFTSTDKQVRRELKKINTF